MQALYDVTYNEHGKYGNVLIFKAVERFIKKMKTHQNFADEEKGEFKRIWKDSSLSLPFYVIVC